eukprot:scaffold103363_cov24-Phaeocystis_antarctica.AAC.1
MRVSQPAGPMVVDRWSAGGAPSRARSSTTRSSSSTSQRRVPRTRSRSLPRARQSPSAWCRPS